MRRKRWIILVVVLAVVGAVGYGGYSLWRRTSAARAEVETPAGETAVVRTDTLRVTVNANGSLSPGDEIEVAFPAGGRVVEMLVEEGDVVQEGDALARLDDADARESVLDAELQVAQAEINLALAQIESDVGIARANLESAKLDYEQAVAQSTTTEDQLTSAVVRVEQAVEGRADAQEDYDNAWDQARDWEADVRWLKDRLESDREITENNLEAAKDELRLARANYNLAVADISDAPIRDAEIKVINAQIALDNEPLELQQLEISLQQAQLKLEAARRALDDLTLVAPIGGTVTTLNIQPGEMAGASQVAVVLSDLAALVVAINLDETDVAQVQVGQEVIVSLDAFPGVELGGEVSYIAPTAQVQSGVVLYPVRIALGLTELPVRAGMTAGVDIVMVSQESALIVPLRAIQSEGGASYVSRRSPDGFERVEVSLGVMTDTEVEITDGLSDGDVISVVPAPANGGQGGFGPMRMFGGGEDE